MIKIEFKLYASLKVYMPGISVGSSPVMEIREGTRIGELLGQLKIPPGSVKIIFLNGVHSTPDAVLKEGDKLGVFPPVAGG